mgnify:CR=1 FL=1
MANWTKEAIEKAKETRRKNKEKKAQAEAARQAEFAELRAEVERLRGAGTVTISASEPAEMAALREENEHLKECMKQAGLLAFMNGKSPEHIASHLRGVTQSYVNSIDEQRQRIDTLRATVADQKALLTDKAAQLFKASADNMTLSKGLSTARAEIADLEMNQADRDAVIAKLRLEVVELLDELDAASLYAVELKEQLTRRQPASGISAATVTMAINILRTASDTLALALEDDGRIEDDKPRVQWRATETVGIGIDNPERVRTTEDGKTVLMPTSDYSVGVVSELTTSNREVVPITRFGTRPSEVATEITQIENERILATALGEADWAPIAEIPIAEPEDKPLLEAVVEAEDKRFLAELEEQAEEDLNAHPYPVPVAAPPRLEEMTMLELNRLAIDRNITPSGNRARLLALLGATQPEVSS